MTTISRVEAQILSEKELTSLKQTLDEYIKDDSSYKPTDKIKISEMKIGKVYLIDYNGYKLVKMVNKFPDVDTEQTHITSIYINTKQDQYQPSKKI